MSMGSKNHGPSLPVNLSGKGPALSGKRRKGKKRTAKSPRVIASLGTGGTHGRGAPNAVEPAYIPVPVATDTMDVARPRLNTNANRRHGGSSTYYRMHTEDLAGRDIIDNGTRLTAPYVAPMGRRRIGASVEVAKTTSVAENLRLEVAARHHESVSMGIPDPETNAAWPDKWNFRGR